MSKLNGVENNKLHRSTFLQRCELKYIHNLARNLKCNSEAKKISQAYRRRNATIWENEKLKNKFPDICHLNEYFERYHQRIQKKSKNDDELHSSDDDSDDSDDSYDMIIKNKDEIEKLRDLARQDDHYNTEYFDKRDIYIQTDMENLNASFNNPIQLDQYASRMNPNNLIYTELNKNKYNINDMWNQIKEVGKTILKEKDIIIKVKKVCSCLPSTYL